MRCEELEILVSTHSRLKAAGKTQPCATARPDVSTHSRLKAAGYLRNDFLGTNYSFNTQPPEGGWDVKPDDDSNFIAVSTHSRLKAAGYPNRQWMRHSLFQHTAA